MAVGVSVISRTSYRRMPWKNGGGTTEEIAAGDGWRLSLATIERDGWFSEFPGYDRTIVPVEGNGIALTIDGVERSLAANGMPFAFRGEAKTWCRLIDGAARDFNVMSQRATYRHEVRARLAEGPLEMAIASLCFVFVRGGTFMGAASGDTVRIEGRDAVRLDEAADVLLVSLARCESGAAALQ